MLVMDGQLQCGLNVIHQIKVCLLFLVQPFSMDHHMVNKQVHCKQTQYQNVDEQQQQWSRIKLYHFQINPINIILDNPRLKISVICVILVLPFNCTMGISATLNVPPFLFHQKTTTRRSLSGAEVLFFHNLPYQHTIICIKFQYINPACIITHIYSYFLGFVLFLIDE